ncbi:MAG: hypothetical protein WBV80_07155 [Mycobacterium sp.]
MTVLAGVAALLMAAGLGYYMGRRQAVAPPTWKQRTSRIALGKLTIDLLLALAARRVRRSTVAVVASSLVARARTY